jgi:predicted GNAT superfamily acetyltransferase
MWTFDPLVSRNAHFNINRLGAMPIEYAANMYGTTRSALHGSLPTDRFIVAWDCASDAAPRPDASLDWADAPLVNPVSNATPSLSDIGTPVHARVQIPSDIQPIIQRQPALATRWREITRRIFSERLADGYHVSAFVRPRTDAADALPYYVLTRQR